MLCFAHQILKLFQFFSKHTSGGLSLLRTTWSRCGGSAGGRWWAVPGNRGGMSCVNSLDSVPVRPQKQTQEHWNSCMYVYKYICTCILSIHRYVYECINKYKYIYMHIISPDSDVSLFNWIIRLSFYSHRTITVLGERASSVGPTFLTSLSIFVHSPQSLFSFCYQLLKKLWYEFKWHNKYQTAVWLEHR